MSSTLFDVAVVVCHATRFLDTTSLLKCNLCCSCGSTMLGSLYAQPWMGYITESLNTFVVAVVVVAASLVAVLLVVAVVGDVVR
eukprot:4948094-Amphidinium_carterae.1